MALCIRYVSTPTDWYLAQSPHHDGGVWVHDVELAKEFASEAAAKKYLIEREYDLPAANVVYESLIPGRTN